MRNRIVAGMLLAFSCINATAQTYEERAQAYIKQYRRLAMEEQTRSGIPAAITLAQGIHETAAGSSELATEANNHFGIKCKKSWTGETFAHTDDAPNECFRKYKSADASYKDHSDYLVASPRYAELFKLSVTDYAAWAAGLKKAGYATNPRYANVLIKLIEDYRLQEYTYIAMETGNQYNPKAAEPAGEVVPVKDAVVDIAGTTPAIPVTATLPVQTARAGSRIKVAENAVEIAETPAIDPVAEPQKPAATAEDQKPEYGRQLTVNGLKAVYARKGDMPLEYAIKFDIRYEKLLEFNDISDRPLHKDMFLYLERKRVKGTKISHVVQDGESLHDVAQYEGMQLKSLRSLNQLQQGEEPVVGSVLLLQEETIAKPIVAAGTQASVPTPAIAEVVPQQIVEAPAPQIVEAAATTTAIETVNTPAIAATTNPAEVTIETEDSPEIASAVTVEKPTDFVEPEPYVKQVPNPPVNIANEPAVEEVMKKEKEVAKKEEKQAEPEKPLNELDALKARFDKVVYATRTTTPPPSAVTETAAPPKEEAKATPPPAPPVVETKAPEKPKEVAKPKEEVVKAEVPRVISKFYVVKKGDTAFGIAKKHNITMRELLSMNDLDFRELKEGQKLRVKD
jgi:Muramidase (flagellum-specific)